MSSVESVIADSILRISDESEADFVDHQPVGARNVTGEISLGQTGKNSE